MDREDSTALLARARQGSREALNSLYGRVAAKLLAIVRLRLGPSLRARLESRDILQAALLRSFERLEQFDGRDSQSLMSWLARIAENEIRDRADYFGRQRRDAALDVPIEDTAVGVPGVARSVLSRMLIDERSTRLVHALEELPVHHREIIVLRKLEERTFPEIGSRLGKSEDACRMLFARAMAALTLRLKDEP
ncbi:MAG: sigma-70 family RNA polymerase sigma factor [Acidobacteria bacterium]|nr:sigma-70 family RNA polymerase sigma factor [Acidobacteriota bacterium]